MRLVGGALDPGIPFAEVDAAPVPDPNHGPDRPATLLGAPLRPLDKIPISLC